MNLITDPFFSNEPSDWSLFDEATFKTDIVLQGSKSLELVARESFIGPGQSSATISIDIGDLASVPGYIFVYPITVHPNCILGVDWREGIVWQSLWGNPTNVLEVGKWQAIQFEASPIFEVPNMLRLRMVTNYSGPPALFESTVRVDVVVLGQRTQEELLMKSTVPEFMTKLATLIVGLDSNIGTVFTKQQLWKTTKELDDDAGIIIQGNGILDEASQSGTKAVRFWLLEPWIEPDPLTNGSAEYRNRVTITGFYQHQEGGSQEEVLRNASIEILDALHTKANELTTLNTGSGYLGFLNSRPRMLGPVRNGRLGEDGTKIIGHVVQMEVTFFEEIVY